MHCKCVQDRLRTVETANTKLRAVATRPAPTPAAAAPSAAETSAAAERERQLKEKIEANVHKGMLWNSENEEGMLDVLKNASDAERKAAAKDKKLIDDAASQFNSIHNTCKLIDDAASQLNSV